MIFIFLYLSFIWHKYLPSKGVEAVAIHGGLDQEERHEAIRGFKEGTKDVLIGTDVLHDEQLHEKNKTNNNCPGQNLG